jgi:hypothetical protein
MKSTASSIVAVTDLSAASYQLLGFALLVLRPGGRLVLVSTLGGSSSARLLRTEAQAITAQVQWCSDRGADCRAVLQEGGAWGEFVIATARDHQADLIMLSLRSAFGDPSIADRDIQALISKAPCHISVLRAAHLDRREPIP